MRTKNGNIKEEATGFTCYMDTILRASSYKEKLDKILVPFKVSKKMKKKLIEKNFIIETSFGDLKNIKNLAIEKKIKFYLKSNKILRTEK